jgi:hypothetical protein
MVLEVDMADLIYNNVRRKGLIGQINFSSDTFKMLLMNTSYSPAATHQSYGDVSTYEVSGSGYTPGGATLAGISITETNGVCTWTFTSPTWASCTLSGVRYAIIYDSTAAQLIKCIDFGTALNIASGPFTVNVPVAGVLQWA